jgi:flagellar biosynthesis component FlhA
MNENNVKLTEDQVIDIYTNYVNKYSNQVIANKFKTHKNTIRAIRLGQSWKSITKDLIQCTDEIDSMSIDLSIQSQSSKKGFKLQISKTGKRPKKFKEVISAFSGSEWTPKSIPGDKWEMPPTLTKGLL